MSRDSLGLYPAVYFYSATGAYRPTAFLAAISFVQELESKNELNKFIENRYSFEELLLKYKYLINQIVRHYGSGGRGLVALTRLYRYLFDGAVDRTEESKLVPVLVGTNVSTSSSLSLMETKVQRKILPATENRLSS